MRVVTRVQHGRAPLHRCRHERANDSVHGQRGAMLLRAPSTYQHAVDSTPSLAAARTTTSRSGPSENPRRRREDVSLAHGAMGVILQRGMRTSVAARTLRPSQRSGVYRGISRTWVKEWQGCNCVAHVGGGCGMSRSRVRTGRTGARARPCRAAPSSAAARPVAARRSCAVGCASHRRREAGTPARPPVPMANGASRAVARRASTQRRLRRGARVRARGPQERTKGHGKVRFS